LGSLEKQDLDREGKLTLKRRSNNQRLSQKGALEYKCNVEKGKK
jgi:hypothetical protein